MGKSILVVDDSRAIRCMLVNVLSTAGHSVSEACTGTEGAAMAGENRFDLIITDVNMPEMNGFELAQHLRQTPQYKFAPIVFLTTESGENFKDKGKAVGATAWITKPFSPQALLNVIAKVV